MEHEPKRRGRKPNPKRGELQKARRFIPLEKSPAVLKMMQAAHARYRIIHGKKGSDAAVLRDALALYTGSTEQE
jgi:hypothetical protein